METIQDQLGRSRDEVALELHNNKYSNLNEEEKKRMRGALTFAFPDVMEYDPVNDVIYSKLAFKYSGKYYLTSAEKIIEGIHKEFNDLYDRTPRRWWGELLANNPEIKAAWRSIPTSHKSYSAMSKTMEELTREEEKFKLGSGKISVVDVEKLFGKSFIAQAA